MGDENPIRTLGDYSKPSHEGYRNTIELPVGNNVVPLRSDTIRLVQNGCSFHGLRSEDPNQHLKDFLKLVDSLDLDGENRERTRLRGLVSEFMASQDAKLSTQLNIDTVLKAITVQVAGTLPSDTFKNPKLGTHPVSSARSYPTQDPQSSTHIHSSINAITIHPKQPEESYVNEPDESSFGNISSNPHPQPDPLASIATEQVRKLNSMLESLRLVPQSSNTKIVCTKEEDGEVMFIEIIRDDDEPQNESPNEGEGTTTEGPANMVDPLLIYFTCT
ncbi:hypothetical protein Tco_0838899 [Tanacetum coccineum]|uniref:MAK10-like protein n=1 Tax=Tanacetum coccineum TaxID=301880 RepID=A0ABQ5ASB7_9ASTR